MCFRPKDRIIDGTAALLLIITAAIVSTVHGQSVDPLTGSLQYGIPLGQLSANDITIPVGISQHGNALTVAEGEGDCGMGWSLSAGGAVTRLVRGLPDDLDDTRKGWTKMATKHARIQSWNPAGDDILNVCSDEANDFLTLDSLAYTYDTEPDLFFFQAPGINGQFILNASGQPQLLNLQDLAVSNFRSDSFSIKTNQGIVYSFTAVENTARLAVGTYCDFSDFRYNASNEIEFTSRWLLTRIQSTATGTTARLTYKTLPEVSSYVPKEDSLFYLRDRFQPRRLSTIQLKTYRAEFTWANQVISRVKFKETVSGNAKTFEFYYKTPQDWKSTQKPFPVAKTFLYKLREVGPNCSPYSSYEFTYQGVNWAREALAKPWKKNNQQDWFGYYTGRAGSFHLPTVYFFDNETDDARRVRMVNQGGGTLSQTQSGYDRSVLPDSALFGALIKVTTPAGGIVEVSWESNAYYDSALMMNATGGGLRVKKISTNGSDVAYGKTADTFTAGRAITRSYEYLESNGTSSSGKLLAPLKFGYYTHRGRTRTATNKGDPSDIMYARVKEVIDTLGYTLYEFSIPGVFPQTQKYGWKATWSRIARKSGTDCACDNYRNGYFAYPFPPSTNFGHRRGFLKGVYQYSNGGTLVRKREMTALQLPVSPPAAVKGIRFEKTDGNRFYYGVYEILTGRSQVVGSETVTEYPESGSTPLVTTTQYTYNATTNKLSQITETLADNSTRVTSMKYAEDYTFSGTPTQTAAVALKALKDTRRHGELIEQTTQVTEAGGSALLTGASLVSFKTFANGKTLPAYIYTVRRGSSITPSSIDDNALEMDPDYVLVRTFNDYDSEGRVLGESDDKQNKVAHSYSTAYGYEAATFAHAESGTSVYEGFESATTAGLTVSGGSPGYASGWTGEKALELTSSLTLISASLSEGTATKFRISCWAKASSATTVYFKAFSGSLYDIGTLSVDNSNQWKYYEAVVTPSTVPTTFTLKVTATGAVTLDDIVFAPAEARVSLQTAMPLVGVTSATDDRGNSVTFAYDVQGRKVGTLDRKRNLVQKIDYANQKSLGAEVSAGFTSSATAYKVGTAITYTALDSCSQGASPTYAWKVDGTTESTGNQLTKTMTIPGRHNIRLEVTKSGIGTATFNQDICFELAGNPDINAEDTQSNPYANGFTANCNTPTLTFIANNIPTGISGCTTTITWRAINYIWVTDHYEVNVLSQLGTGASKTYAPGSAVTIQAMVQIDCTSGSDLTCLGGSNYFILGFDINWETVNCN